MQSRAAPQFQGSRTIDSRCHCNQAADETCCARGPPNGRDQCKQRPLLGPGRGGHLPLTLSSHIPFHEPAPQGSSAAGRAATGPTRGRGRTLFFTQGPRLAFGRPRSHERDCESGRPSRHRWAQIEMGHGGPGLVHGWLFRRRPRRSEWTRG